jgi:hypothetical protein
MYGWLRRKFEYRSIAEMSIWYTITAVVSFMVMFLLWGWFTGIASGTEEYDEGAENLLFLLGNLFLWLVFLAWLWFGLVRIAWKWHHKRLGIQIFKYLQIGFFVGTVLTMLLRSDLWEHFKLLSGLLLAFDIVIAVMIFNFLVLAWFARCKIPLRAYWEIGSIIVMIVIQVWVFI